MVYCSKTEKRPGNGSQGTFSGGFPGKHLGGFTAIPLLAVLAGVIQAPGADKSLRAQTTPAATTPALKKVDYSWKKVRGARGYRVQVRDKDGKVILNERVAINRIRMTLVPGEYQHRIAALNKFLRPARWSGWLPFAVRQIRTPVMRGLEPRSLTLPTPDGGGTTSGTNKTPGSGTGTGTGTKTTENPSSTADKGPREIRIRGEHFLRVTRVRFASGDGDLRVLSRRVENAKLIVVTVDGGNLRPGSYDLVLTNPGNKEFRGVGAFIINYKRKTTVIVKKEDPDKDKVKVELPRFARDRRTIATGKGPGRPFSRDQRPWEPLIPGMAQFSRGNNTEGFIWAGVYGALTLGAANELVNANRALGASKGDAFQNLFSDPVLLVASRSFLPLTNQEVLTLGLYAQQQNSALAAKYARHQQNQAILGGVALLGYLGHIYRETFSDWKWDTAIPGLPQWRSGNHYWAMFWASSFAGLVGGSLYYNQSANSRASDLSSNGYYQIFNNPLLLSATYSSLTSSSQRETFLLNGLQTVNAATRQEALYERDRKAHTALSGLAVAAYVGHIIHALYFNSAPGKISATQEPPGSTRSFFTLGAAPDEKGRTQTTVRWTLLY